MITFIYESVTNYMVHDDKSKVKALTLQILSIFYKCEEKF